MLQNNVTKLMLQNNFKEYSNYSVTQSCTTMNVKKKANLFQTFFSLTCQYLVYIQVVIRHFYDPAHSCTCKKQQLTNQKQVIVESLT